jgi:hypothetical protein
MNTAPTYLVLGIQPHHDLVEAWSMLRLSFEPKGWLRHFREDLGQAIRRLAADAGQVLHADYISESRELCDAENVLFYNVGSGCFARSASAGLRFERGHGPIPQPPVGLSAEHYHRYRLSPAGSHFVHWRRGRTLARWEDALFDSSAALRLPAQVWARTAAAAIELEGVATDGQLFGLSVTMHYPEGRALNLANLVKTVFDGVITAFHVHSGPIPDQVRSHLSQVLSISSIDVDARLRDGRRAVLGARRLVWPFGRTGIQWNPADDRCVAGELLTAPARGTAWRLSGALFEVQPTSAQTRTPPAP